MADATNINPALEDLSVPLMSLKADPRNARYHDQRSVDAIAISLREFGQQKPIVTLKDGIIIAGNGTFLAAKKLGWNRLAAVVFESEEKARAFALADNRTAELSEWDNAELARTLEELMQGDLTPDMVGFSAVESQKLLALLQPLPTTDNEEVEHARMSMPVPEGASPSHVRMVQLFLNDQNQPEFMERCKALAAKYGTPSLTDTVLKAVEEEHARLCKQP